MWTEVTSYSKNYKEIAEACLQNNTEKRAEGIYSFLNDSNSQEMLPIISKFVAERVQKNVKLKNMTQLVHLMNMVKVLHNKHAVHLEKHLDLIIPSVLSCILSRQLCNKPDNDHWALRDTATRLMSRICDTFNNSTSNVRTRVTTIFSRVLNSVFKESRTIDISIRSKIVEASDTPLTSVYGVLKGLSALGPEVIKIYILPRVSWLGKCMQAALSEPASDNNRSDSASVGKQTERLAAEKIQKMLIKVLVTVLVEIRKPPDSEDLYVRHYGYLGPALHEAVAGARIVPNVMPMVEYELRVIPNISECQNATT